MAPVDLDPRSWMSRVPDHLLLSALSIPGTHDSACRRGNVKPSLVSLGGDFVYTQYKESDLTKQLNTGIRFLDYRVAENGQLRHGPAELYGNLFDELRTAVRFLQAHSSETICVSVKWEKEDIEMDGLTPKIVSQPEPPNAARQTIDEMLNVCSTDRLWLEPRTPTLGEARGKIVFLTRYDAVTKEGIRYHPGGEDLNNPKNPPYRSQDHYDLTDSIHNNAPQVKFDQYVLPFMNQAMNNKTEMQVWYFNFGSGYAGSPLPFTESINPVDIAWDSTIYGQPSKGVNTLLIQFLSTVGSARVGILLMDFIRDDVVQAVYKTNQFI